MSDETTLSRRRAVPFTLYGQDTLHLVRLDQFAAALNVRNVFDDDPRAARREDVLVGRFPNV